ncbi:putative transcription factor bZIP family [Helianthus anomalus]
MSKVIEVEKYPNVEIPKEAEVQNVEVPEVNVTGVRVSTPPPPPPPIPEAPESSRPKNKGFPDLFGVLPHATGVYKDDLGLDDDFDMFNNAAVKELEKKVGELEKEKAKAEAERDVLKKQVKELTNTNEEIKTVMISQAKKLKKLKDGVHDNAQLFELLTTKNDEMIEKMKKLQEVNQTLNSMISYFHEATSNEM